MSSSSLLLCLLWAAAAATSAVRDIHVAEFERVTGRDGGWWLIELYAPWCGHCRALEPTWVDIAAHLEGRMRVARVDASGGTQGMPVRADGFPTIVLYRCVWWVGVPRQDHGLRTGHREGLSPCPRPTDAEGPGT